MADDAETRFNERLEIERRQWQPSFAPLFSDPLVEAQWTEQLTTYYTPTDGLTCMGILLPAFAVLIRIKDGMLRTWKVKMRPYFACSSKRLSLTVRPQRGSCLQGTNSLISQIIVLLVCGSLFIHLALIHYKPVHYRCGLCSILMS